VKRRVGTAVRALGVASVAIAGISLAQAADTLVAREPATKVRARVLQLVNEARATSRRCGEDLFPAAPPLVESPPLRKAAQRHADDMAQRGYFEHRGKDGSEPHDRVRDAGYSYRLTGENIAFGPDSAEEVMKGWLGSPGHCANIMEAGFTDLGVAMSTGRKRGHIYWVQEFGRPLRTD
jgi:uncharacterized protein YkwD